MEQPVAWTLDELVELVRAVLSVDYDGPPNGRVRDLPDRRAIRWYTTVGLVDRSTLVRGRTALYGERQLLQVVAIKRRQAQGRSLAEIQQELTGATDDTLRGIARVPADLLAGAEPPPRTQLRQRFWTRPAVAGAAPPSGAGGAGPAAAPAAARPEPMAARPEPMVARPEPVAGRPEPVAGRPEPVAVAVTGVALPGGVVLVLPAGAPPLDQADLAALTEAARPLIDALASGGYISTEPVPTDRRTT